MTTLILPGLNGSGEDHWQRHWLADHGDAILVAQEHWDKPVLEDWLHTLESELVAHPGAVLVAHSLGCILAAKLAGRPAAEHVAGAVLVAPCDIDVTNAKHPGLIDFGAMPRRRLPFPTIFVASRNDTYMDFDIAQEYAGIWGSGLVDIGDAGHINVASGFGRWEDGYALASCFKFARVEVASRAA
ncbi:serine hydrolase family protein [Mesorhizobium sp. CGMCC 1.15528]|uniref:Serine hydrolase family protein n=1 Tax=Mesorhizobium zhangyense TaxID=1776730 RepID=A0A7C9V890_9HYPH|nr:alpha/beta hydrolase [Mesorhizobium zhangyense]NGN41066.1 serine hydrolase family protein [Mesorhizobium zhangyense]